MSPLMYTKEVLSILGSWPIRHSRGGGQGSGAFAEPGGQVGIGFILIVSL